MLVNMIRARHKRKLKNSLTRSISFFFFFLSEKPFYDPFLSQKTGLFIQGGGKPKVHYREQYINVLTNRLKIIM